MISLFTDTLDEPCHHAFLSFHKPGFLQFLEHSEDVCVEDLEESDLCSPAFFLFLEYNFYFFVCLVDDWTFKRMLDLNGDLSLDSEPPPPGLTWSVPWLVGSVVSTAYALCGFPSVDPISSWSENVYKTQSASSPVSLLSCLPVGIIPAVSLH